MVKLDRCVGNCINLNDFSNKVCVPNKKEDLNLSIFNMITEINESKTLAKQISCECKCRFDGRKCNSNQWWNNDKCWCECKKCRVCEKDYFRLLFLHVAEIKEKYLASTLDNSSIKCDEVIQSNNEETKTISNYLNEKKAIPKISIFYMRFSYVL